MKTVTTVRPVKTAATRTAAKSTMKTTTATGPMTVTSSMKIRMRSRKLMTVTAALNIMKITMRTMMKM